VWQLYQADALKAWNLHRPDMFRPTLETRPMRFAQAKHDDAFAILRGSPRDRRRFAMPADDAWRRRWRPGCTERRIWAAGELAASLEKELAQVSATQAITIL